MLLLLLRPRFGFGGMLFPISAGARTCADEMSQTVPKFPVLRLDIVNAIVIEGVLCIHVTIRSDNRRVAYCRDKWNSTCLKRDCGRFISY